ncbi:MAG: hypothetical protein J4F39_05525 [Candidatus Latescibacteria bacterium]|nr:hypothetical protein [Candidatus Latescibacterota bacterium]
MRPDILTNRRSTSVPARETPLSRRYKRILENWVPVGLSYFEDWPERPNCGHFFGGAHWYGSDTAGPAFVFAALANSPEYDSKRTGCSKEELRELALKGIRYLCFTHDTGPAECIRPEKSLGNPRTWGTKWGERGRGFFPESQCGTNLSDVGLTALLLGNMVDDETWTMIARMHEDYAERFGAMAPKSGVYTNTQMEENGWTSCGLASVECFLSNSPHAKSWAETARRWMFSTTTTQQDTKNHAQFSDGQTVRELTGQTFVALPDYMAENHGMVHPSYTGSSVMFTGRLGIIYGTFGAKVPEHALFNRREIYDQLKRTTDRTGSMHPVQGMDWPYIPPDSGTLTHATAALFLDDPDGAFFESRALETLEQRAESVGGRMHDRQIAEIVHGPQDPLIIREHNIVSPAHTYFLHRIFGDGPDPASVAAVERRLTGVKVYPHSGFVFHRHRTGQSSLSWRNDIMALPLNKDGLYTVAPASGSFLANIDVQDRPDSHDLVSVRVDEQQDGFAAAMILDRAQRSVRQEVLFAGLPSGISLSCERLTARETITVQSVDQGFLRIVNEDFKALRGNCNGYRTVHTPGGSDRFDSYVTRDPDSDVVKTYDHPAWLNVDNRMGIVYTGTGKTVYHNRHHYKVWRAVADDLTLSRVDEPFPVTTGKTISELTALIAPDCSHQETSGIDSLILEAGRSAIGLLADNHLAVANFGEKSAAFTFRAKRSELSAIPIFEGVTRLDEDNIAFDRNLGAGDARLQEAILNIETDGALEVNAAETGVVWARNTGAASALVTHNGTETRIPPGEIAVLK